MKILLVVIAALALPLSAFAQAYPSRPITLVVTGMRMLVLPVVLALVPSAHAGGMSNELLLSSAWCTFTYNKTTGYSNTKRFYFSANGTYGMGGRGEGYSSGSGGSMASQRNSAGAGRWRVDKGELFMSEGNAKLEHVVTVLKRNNNGYPIIVADGVEYSQCR